MLLPARSKQIKLHEDGPNIRVTYRDRYWSFPRDECVLVPVANTTAELLADYIAGRLRQAMTDRGWKLPRILRVEVEESFGQSAAIRMAPGRRRPPLETPARRDRTPRAIDLAARFGRHGTPRQPARRERRRS